MPSYRKTISVEFDGSKAARRLRKGGTRIEVGLGTVTRQVTSQAASSAEQRGRQLGGVHRHVLPGLIAKGNNIRLDRRRQPAIMGAVFGGGRSPRTRQFPPWKGSGRDAGYMLFPDLAEQERQVDATITKLIDKAL